MLFRSGVRVDGPAGAITASETGKAEGKVTFGTGEEAASAASFFARGGEAGKATGGRLCVLAAAWARLWLRSSRRTGIAAGGEGPPPPIESSVMRMRRAVSVVRRDPFSRPGEGPARRPDPGSSMGLLGMTACGAAGRFEPDDWSGRDRLACPAAARPP